MATSEQPPPPTGTWLDWDGRTLRWQIPAPAEAGALLELRLDGVVFERMPWVPGEFAREFDFSPSGDAQMELSLHAGDRALTGVWRVRHGHPADVGVDQWRGSRRDLQPLADTPLPGIALGVAGPPVAIVVPIFNSAQLLESCVSAVLRWSQGPAQLILIDDASDDPAMAPLLARYAGCDNISVRRNARNLGYTRSTNLGIELAGNADIVFLNSDTDVGPRWLDRLRAVAYGDAAIGTVTAVSDNAGAFSVPELERYCPIPQAWSLEQAQRALLQNAGGCLPQLPTGNGFCMYVKRAMLDRIGVLDADAFPSGYGEENDLCQRAEQAGFRHVIAGDVLVRHARSASFGAARRALLGAQGMAVLRSRYPDYEAKVGATLYSFERRALDYRVRRLYAGAEENRTALPARPRVLLAGTGAREVAATGALEPAFDCLVMMVDAGQCRLHRVAAAGLDPLAEAATTDAQALRVWLARYAIELVHLVGDATIGLRQAAAAMGVPVAEPAADWANIRDGILLNNLESVSSRGQLLAYCAALYRGVWARAARWRMEIPH